MSFCLEIMNSSAGCIVSVVPVVCTNTRLSAGIHISPPLGRHNCLWCHITSSCLAKPLAERGRYKERTLETLQSDHKKFISIAGGNLKKAKEFNNVIGDYFFDIPLENVRVQQCESKQAL